jgi:hypothetical protein
VSVHPGVAEDGANSAEANVSVHPGVAEARSKLLHEELTENVIGAAIEVHRELGPGLLESAFEEGLCHELRLHGLSLQRQVPLPVKYKNINLDCGYRIDLIVEDAIIWNRSLWNIFFPSTKLSFLHI